MGESRDERWYVGGSEFVSFRHSFNFRTVILLDVTKGNHFNQVFEQRFLDFGVRPDQNRAWPLAVSGGPQQHHDHQQNGGEQETPEGIIYPQVPPTLWKRMKAENSKYRDECYKAENMFTFHLCINKKRKLHKANSQSATEHTVWQSTSLKTLVVQMMNTMEAVGTK